MTVINFRQGRLYVESGDTPTPLSKVMAFSGGTFEFTETRERNIVRDRGEVVEVTPGDSQPVEWSFQARYEDKTSFRTVRDGVWDATVDQITGLTAGALNSNVATTYDYEQNSLQIEPNDPIAPGTKLAIAAVPAAAGEFSENTGAQNIESVVTVPRAAAFNIFMPAADTDVDMIYDAVGQPTLQSATGTGCQGSVTYFRLRLDIYDPCDPPSVLDLTRGTVTERILIEFAYLVEDSFAEDEEANEISFSGQALDEKVTFVTV